MTGWGLVLLEGSLTWSLDVHSVDCYGYGPSTSRTKVSTGHWIFALWTVVMTGRGLVLWIFGQSLKVDRKTWLLSSMPSVWGDWLFLIQGIDASVLTDLYWLGNGLARPLESEFYLLSGLRLDKHPWGACNEWGMWFTCWWPSLLQLATWESTTTAVSIVVDRLLVVLYEGRDLCCPVWQGELCLKFVRSGEQGGFGCGFMLQSILQLAWWTPICEGGLCAIGIRAKWIVVTWLILPVVICLSQRLSHACLSINNFVLWNCEWLIKSVIVYLMVLCYMDNCGNSRANTCNQAPTSGRGVFIR